MIQEIKTDYDITKQEESLLINSGKITITDTREEGETILTIQEGSEVHYKATGNTKKKFFIEKNATLYCYDLGKEITTRAELLGEKAQFIHKGLLIGTGQWTIAAHHKAAQTTSDLNIRTVLSKEERAQIDGLIKIETNCPQTNGNQRIDTLMLDESAIINALPQLEIATDDVSCSHAATMSQLDEESLFYLQTRGIEKQEAKTLLIEGFINFNETITELLEEQKGVLE